MFLHFYKFQATGNDFILIDDRKQIFEINKSNFISSLCERRFGIGADGLILLRNHDLYDFEMIFFNSTGEKSTFCGNGGRCIIAFANFLSIFDKKCTFLAYDGVHIGEIHGNKVSMKMADVDNITINKNYTVLDTGSPHLIKLVEDISNVNVLQKGKEISSIDEFGSYGINVNFVDLINGISIRTYERGDEMESNSCGTGSVAAAITLFELGKIKNENVELNTNGGILEVKFNKCHGHYTNIWLTGDVNLVYSGKIEI
tara:strand:- start:28532 stop:29305 length:774 start_codon:yes stop_codon:yes gene_type:complete